MREFLIAPVEQLLARHFHNSEHSIVELRQEEDQARASLDVLEIHLPFAEVPINLVKAQGLRAEIINLVFEGAGQDYIHLRFPFNPRQRASDWQPP